MRSLETVKGAADCPPEGYKNIKCDATEGKRRTHTVYHTAGSVAISEPCRLCVILFKINIATVVGVGSLRWAVSD